MMTVFPGPDHGKEIGLSTIQASSKALLPRRRASIGGGGSSEYHTHGKYVSSTTVSSWFQTHLYNQQQNDSLSGGNALGGVDNNNKNFIASTRNNDLPDVEINLRSFLPSHYNRASLHNVVASHDEEDPHCEIKEVDVEENTQVNLQGEDYGDVSTFGSYSVIAGLASAVAPLQAAAAAVANAGGVRNVGSCAGPGERKAGRRWSMVGNGVSSNHVSVGSNARIAREGGAIASFLPQHPTKRRPSSEIKSPQQSQSQVISWQRAPDHERDGYSYNYAYSGYYDRRQALVIGGPKQCSSQEQRNLQIKSSCGKSRINHNTASGNVFQSLQNSIQAVAEKLVKGGSELNVGSTNGTLKSNGMGEVGPTMHEMALQIVRDKDEFRKLQESLRLRGNARTSMGLRQELCQSHLLRERYESVRRTSLDVDFSNRKASPSTALTSEANAHGGRRMHGRRLSMNFFSQRTPSDASVAASPSLSFSTSIQPASSNNQAVASMVPVESRQQPARRRFSLSYMPQTISTPTRDDNSTCSNRDEKKCDSSSTPASVKVHSPRAQQYEESAAISIDTKQLSRRSMMQATQELAHHATPLQVDFQSQVNILQDQQNQEDGQTPVQWSVVRRRRSIW